MQLHDLVYPFWHTGDKTIGIIVRTYNNRTSVFDVFANGKVYMIPKHRLVLAW
jgi:hypothetical protein